MLIDEAINIIKPYVSEGSRKQYDDYVLCNDNDRYEALKMTIEWLEELKEYRNGFIEARQTDYENAYAKGLRDGYNAGVTDSLKTIEESVWKDTEMLVENINELKQDFYGGYQND